MSELDLDFGFDSSILDIEIAPSDSQTEGLALDQTHQEPGSRHPEPAATPSREQSLAIPLAEGEEPPEREWLVDKLVPKGHLTILSADGGAGKSMIALHLSFCVATGEPFFGIDVMQGAVLWTDAEHLGKDEVKRRAHQIARGWGNDGLPDGLFYYAPKKPLGHDKTIVEIGEIVRAHDIRLIIVDSLTIGGGGADMSNQRDVVPLLNKFFEWGVTVFALDHISKAARDSGAEKASIFGSVHKRNMARSTLKLFTKDDTRSLAQDKSNFGPIQAPISYVMDFAQDDEGRVSISFRSAAPPPMFSDGKPPTKHWLTFKALERLYEEKGEPVSVDELAEALGAAKKTIQNHMTLLKEEKDVIAQGTGHYIPGPGF